MTILQRAASIAAAILCVFGLCGPASAAEISVVPFLPSSSEMLVAVPPVATSLPSVSAIVAKPHFASLAAAIDAQIVGDATPQDLACLAVAIYFEAKGEPLPGQLAVANVILNRIRSGRYPSDACSVVTQRGQFSFVRGGQLPSVDPAKDAYRTALKLAKVATAELWDSAAPRALFFHATRIGMGRGGTAIAQIGRHIFYR